jgi:flagellar basal-body rod modification protein FlgD
MEVTAGSAAAATRSSQTSNVTGNNLAETFDNFLVLLTTQLKNQDPLSPLDSTQFTEQLATFTGVEQQINTNQRLDQLLNLQAMSQVSAAVGYIGNLVEANSNKVMLQDGQAAFSYTLGGNTAKAEILVVNAQGDTVRTLRGDTNAGAHKLVWDGKNANGTSLPEGIYSIQVRAADQDGKTVPASVTTTGRITGIDAGAQGLDLLIGKLAIPLNDILSVHEDRPQTAGAAS